MTQETSNRDIPASGRHVGLAALFISVLLSASAAGFGAYYATRGSVAAHGNEQAKADAAELYQCPMHPTITQDHPGECPICGMKLVKVNSGNTSKGGSAGERKILYYRSPMDPKQTAPAPRKDEMGMDYVPVYEDEVSGSVSSVEGLATVNIDPGRQQLIGLKTVEAIRGNIGGTIRTVGRVTIDETRIRHINLKVPGFVERVFVDFVGKPVRKGDPLYSIYSPELLSAQEEYLLALKNSRRSDTGDGYSQDRDELVAAALRRLRLWDIPESEIERIKSNGTATKVLTIHSPISGVVTKKDVVEGMKLDAGAMPYEIVDLSLVWVLADVYESELRYVKVGMPAKLTLNAYPNKQFSGKVVFIAPLFESSTRTVKVRLVFSNPTGELRPEMFGEVLLEGSPREVLRIPTDAVIDSGTKKVVFVALGEGKFQPREVQLGESDRTFVEVVSGVEESEKVVVRANFLIDSESRLRASLAEIAGSMPTPPPNPEASSDIPPPPDEGQAKENTHAGHGGGKP